MSKELSSTACYVPLASDDDVVAVGVLVENTRKLRTFCCCDVRWATIIMNLITITFNSMAIIGMFVGVKVLEKNVDMVDDDAVEKAVESGSIYLLAGVFDAIFFIGIALHSLGVYGAVHHKPWAIKVAALTYAIPCLWSVLGFNPFYASFYALFLYPHVALLNEIEEKSGAMADSNARPISCIEEGETDEDKPLVAKQEYLAAPTAIVSKATLKQDPIDPLLAEIYPNEIPELELDPSVYQAKQEEIEQRIETLKQLIMEQLPDLDESAFKANCDECREWELAWEAAENENPPNNGVINQARNKINNLWGVKIQNSSLIVEEVDFDQLEPLVLECCILIQSTPKRLAQFCSYSEEQNELWANFTNDIAMMKSFVYNGGARYGRYYQALRIHTQLIADMGFPSPERRKLATAVALELASPILVFRRPIQIDPIERFWHYVTAFDRGELTKYFVDFTVHEMRHIVNSDATNEELQWGRDHLKRWRPDQVRCENLNLKYIWSFNTTIPKPQMHWAGSYRELISGGGACGPQSWWCRFIARAYGWPVWGCVQPGHAALSKWCPEVGCWRTYAGMGFNASRWPETRWYPNCPTADDPRIGLYRHGTDFDEDTRARYNGNEGEEYYRIVTFFECIGDIMGEALNYPRVTNNKIWRHVGLSQRRMLSLRDYNDPPNGTSHWPSDNQLRPGVTPQFQTDEKVEVIVENEEFTVPSAIFSHPPPDDMIVQRDDFDLDYWGANYRSRHGDTSIIVMPSYEFGTGNQMWHVIDKTMDEKSFQYEIPDYVPAGRYAVTAKFVTLHRYQIPLFVSGVDVNGIEGPQESVEIPNTEGVWTISDAAVVDLEPGGRLKFTRKFPEDPPIKDSKYRIVIKEFYLKAQ